MKRLLANVAGYTCVTAFWALFFLTLLAGGGR